MGSRGVAANSPPRNGEPKRARARPNAGDEGAALQRLVRYVSCPTLALSATIGNAPELQAWWQRVRDDAASGDRVELVEHTGRFINVQNLVLNPAGKLTALHPCAALRTAQLQGTEKLAFAMTPSDSKSLYEALAKTHGAADTASLKPATFFEGVHAAHEQEREKARAAMRATRAETRPPAPTWLAAFERRRRPPALVSAPAFSRDDDDARLPTPQRSTSKVVFRLSEPTPRKSSEGGLF